jgi:hypothetical protein
MAGQAPILKLRSGALQVAAWKNTGEKGDWFSVKLEKSYKDAQGNWQRTQSLTNRDLLAAARLLETAWDYLSAHITIEGKDQHPVGFTPRTGGQVRAPQPQGDDCPF